MKVSDKLIVITGAGSGMGREMALELVRRGARVAGRPRVTVGTDATMMDRLSRISPVFAANLIYKKMKSLLG